MNKNKENALIVFAREPKQGRVKTRLLTDLDAELVTGLYRAFVQDMMRLALEEPAWQPYLYYADAEENPPFLSGFRDRCAVVRQEGKDLGERMFRAARDCFHQGHQRVIIIGTDCPALCAADLREAFTVLRETPFCLGPSADGGYYLIGMSVLRDELFFDVEWGTGSVLRKTLEKMKQIEHNVSLLSEKEDIDTVASLANYIRGHADDSGAPETAKYIRENQHRLPGD